MNPLEKAIQSALDANEKIGYFFERIGTSKSRGFVIKIYEQIARDLALALESGNMEWVTEVLALLAALLQTQTISLLADARDMGQAEAEGQLWGYGVASLAAGINLSEQINSAADAVAARVHAQATLIRAMALAGADTTQIVGDADAPGVLRWSDITPTLAYFAPALFWQAFSVTVESARPPTTFKKQAIAALDSKTTECCLKVHGQIQPLDTPFHLTGVPRFADHLDWSPFHHRCRTSVALYLGIYDDGLTDKMRSGADAILAERAAGGSGHRAPADAYGG